MGILGLAGLQTVVVILVHRTLLDNPRPQSGGFWLAIRVTTICEGKPPLGMTRNDLIQQAGQGQTGLQVGEMVAQVHPWP